MSRGAGARARGQGNREARRYRPLAYLPESNRRSIASRVVAELHDDEMTARAEKRRRKRHRRTVREVDAVIRRDPVPRSLATLLVEHHVWTLLRRSLAQLRERGDVHRVRRSGTVPGGGDRHVLSEQGAARIVGVVQAGRRLLVVAEQGLGRAPLGSWDSAAALLCEAFVTDEDMEAILVGRKSDGSDEDARPGRTVQDRRGRRRDAGWELGESRTSKPSPAEDDPIGATVRLAIESGLEPMWADAWPPREPLVSCIEPRAFEFNRTHVEN